jgi:hypothetical protein
MTDITIRKCWNIQSKKHPDAQCARSAFYGDFCSLHYKSPVYCRKIRKELRDFTDIPVSIKYTLSSFFKKALVHIQLQKYKRQGPATYSTDISTNDTEVITMEALTTIPTMFRFSVLDRTQIWLFDIRSLFAQKKRNELKPLDNPYTRQEFSQDILLRFQEHIKWLTDRKYYLEFPDKNSEINYAQTCYQRKILDLCLYIDAHGYLTNTQWFEDLTIEKIAQFCKHLDDLWLYDLQLTESDRMRICPSWTYENTSLFADYRFQTRHKSTALDRMCTSLLEFVQDSTEKDNQTLACMYVLIALTRVSESCAETYPWFLQS